MIYAIGDIHGELRKLHRILQLIEAEGLSPTDRLVFVGDYVDRGPDSPGVIELLIKLKEQRPNSIFLRGNHDQAMLYARDIYDPKRETKKTHEDVLWWFNYGGRETIKSYGHTPGHGPHWYETVPESHWEFLEQTQMEFRESPYVFVHAGLVPPGKSWNDDEDPRLWIRDAFIDSKANFGGTVVFGHTPQDLFLPVVMANKVGIDTGAAYGGPLTALVLDPKKPYEMSKVKFLHSS